MIRDDAALKIAQDILRPHGASRMAIQVAATLLQRAVRLDDLAQLLEANAADAENVAPPVPIPSGQSGHRIRVVK